MTLWHFHHIESPMDLDTSYGHKVALPATLRQIKVAYIQMCSSSFQRASKQRCQARLRRQRHGTHSPVSCSYALQRSVVTSTSACYSTSFSRLSGTFTIRGTFTAV